jgi:predicted NBD/HSP70 family sugar kinase
MPSVPSQVRPSLLRRLNERAILSTLQRHGPLSRAEICRHTGISQPTITRLLSSLAAARFIEEEETSRRVVGRPGKIVRLANQGVCVLGCVVGARHCEVVAASLDGAFDAAHVTTIDTPVNYEDLVSALESEARRLVGRRDSTALSLGISVPGLLHRREGRSIVSPNVHQLDGRNLGRDLAERLKIDCTVLQECHALCQAEQTYGAARGIDDFAMLDVSEGLGLGVMQGGRILHGHSGLAGEFGHMTVVRNGRPCGCGNHGCLETVATDAALCSAVESRIGRPIEIDELIREVQAGRLTCKEELDETLDYLAIGVAGVINIFNPSKLFIYGKLLDAEMDLFPQLIARTRTRALEPNFADCEIVRARGNKRLGAIAAAAQAATQGDEPAP